jgi:hypothetical protein
VALGVKFAAGVTLEIQEHPAGLPAHLCAEEGLHDYERYFPCPDGFTLEGQPYSDISFALLEGDFAVRGADCMGRCQMCGEGEGGTQTTCVVISGVLAGCTPQHIITKHCPMVIGVLTVV